MKEKKKEEKTGSKSFTIFTFEAALTWQARCSQQLEVEAQLNEVTKELTKGLELHLEILLQV